MIIDDRIEINARRPTRQFVTICAWCPDHIERTAAAKAAGFDITHGICPACEHKFDDQSSTALVGHGDRPKENV